MEEMPPGFRFFPTEEELISFYLHNKLQERETNYIDRVIPLLHIYRFEPWQLPKQCGELCHGDPEQWFFFVPRQEREVLGGKPSRTTESGYWKATGSPSYVHSSNGKVIGLKKSMVFYKGKAPLGRKTKWKMNEHRAIHKDMVTSIPKKPLNMDGIDALNDPHDPSVLWAQNVNRCRNVIDGSNGGFDFKLKGRNGKPGFYASVTSRNHVPVHPRVVKLLYDMRFYGLYRAGEMDVDHYLITALVERWRPETHTFHVTVGDATVTLEDVEVIWGLPIVGRPVIGRDPDGMNWEILCFRMLEFNT